MIATNSLPNPGRDRIMSAKMESIFPEWAFCHTRSVKSRMFVQSPQPTRFQVDFTRFVIEITAWRR
jgi:hypothetical protein